MAHYFFDLDPSTQTNLQKRYAIIPIPYERTVSYGNGTAAGPQAILDASRQLEAYDEEVKSEVSRQIGIETLPSISFDEREGESAIQMIQQQVEPIVAKQLIPIGLGGEHTVSLGIIRPLIAIYPELQVVQIDAHSDLRDQYLDNSYSHACVMRRVHELGAKIHAVGIRAQCREEAEFAKETGIHLYYDYQRRNNPDWVNEFISHLDPSLPVYLTIDCDGFDPAVLPHTGTPVPGGLNWTDMMALCRVLTQCFTIVGVDVVELAPNQYSQASDFLCAQLIYKLMSYNEAK